MNDHLRLLVACLGSCLIIETIHSFIYISYPSIEQEFLFLAPCESPYLPFQIFGHSPDISSYIPIVFLDCPKLETEKKNKRWWIIICQPICHNNIFEMQANDYNITHFSPVLMLLQHFLSFAFVLLWAFCLSFQLRKCLSRIAHGHFSFYPLAVRADVIKIIRQETHYCFQVLKLLVFNQYESIQMITLLLTYSFTSSLARRSRSSNCIFFNSSILCFVSLARISSWYCLTSFSIRDMDDSNWSCSVSYSLSKT